MEISALFTGLALFAGSIAYVSLPFRQKRSKDTQPSSTHLQKEGQRQVILSALRDLDFDFRTGKVSEEDYKPLRAQLLVKAAEYVEQEKQGDEQLEALIQTRRAAQQPDPGCHHCGARIVAGQRFCSKCGSAVNNELCSSCGKKIQASDLFCPSCGKKIEVIMDVAAQA